MKKYNVAIVGATGNVGRTFIKYLEESNFPIENLYLFSSKKSAGSTIVFKNQIYTVSELTESSFDLDINIALFSAGGDVSKKFAPIARNKGAIVIDNSSAWRMDPNVPLVVPEVNPQAVKFHNGIIANPNCSTIQAVVALKPLFDNYGIKRIVYSTYQAVSGSGVNGIKALQDGCNGIENDFYKYPIFNNCIPQIDSFTENGYTKEEMKMIDETKKIFSDPSLKITATTVRVPVMNSHSESINVETIKPFDIEEIKHNLSNSPGIKVLDDLENRIYPLATIANDKNEVFVGRIRRDFSLENGINFWVVADNVRKGAATNAIQIAEILIKYNLV